MEKPTGSLISFMANKVKSQGGINLAQGIPAFDPPTELLEYLQAIIMGNLHQYAPGKGNQLLLEQLERFYGIQRNQFLVVNGATEAISLLFTYLVHKINSNFSVLAFDPVYESYKHLPRIFNKKFVAFALPKNDGIDFKLFEKTIVTNRVKIILLASPGNPFGKVWAQSEVDTIIDICNRLDVYLIFDAVYSDLYFDRVPYRPLQKISRNVFYVNAFSKKFSITGWRIGYLAAHESHMAGITDVHDYTGLCAPSILQQAVATYIEKHNFGENYTANLRDKLKVNYHNLAGELTLLGFKNSNAQGGYFVWTQLPENCANGLDFALDLYARQKVAIVPGIHFSENGNRFVRLNIARHPNEINLAVAGIREFMRSNQK